MVLVCRFWECNFGVGLGGGLLYWLISCFWDWGEFTVILSFWCGIVWVGLFVLIVWLVRGCVWAIFFFFSLLWPWIEYMCVLR